MVLPTGYLRKLAHVVLNYFGHVFISRVTGFAMGKERFGILGCASNNRTFGSHCAVAEAFDISFIN